MKIKILGTAAAEGWPSPFCRCDNCRKARSTGGKNIRMRSSALINDNTLVDIPPDMQCQCNHFDLDLFDIEHLLITHPHSDHLYATEFLWRRKHFAHPYDEQKILHVYGSEYTRRKIDEAIDGQWDGCRLVFHPMNSWRKLDFNGSGAVTAVPAHHVQYYESFNYLFESDQASVLIAYDTGWYPDETWDQLGDYHLDAVVMDCTNGVLEQADIHMTIRSLLRAKQKMLYMGIIDENSRFIATHFSHNGGLLHDELVKELEPAGVIPAYDGMEFEVARRPIAANAEKSE